MDGLEGLYLFQINFESQKFLGFSLALLVLAPAFSALFNNQSITIFAACLLGMSFCLALRSQPLSYKSIFRVFLIIFLLIVTFFQNSVVNVYVVNIPNSFELILGCSLLYCLLTLFINYEGVEQFFATLRSIGLVISLLVSSPQLIGLDYRAIFPTSFGVWLAMGLATGIAAASWLGKLDHELHNGVLSKITICGTCFAIIGVLCSLGRGALIFISIVCVLFFIRLIFFKGLRDLITSIPVIIVLLLCSYLLLPQMQYDRFANLFSSNSDLGDRLQIYSNILEHLNYLPVMGYGMGHFSPIPHNFALQFVTELGLLGIFWTLIFYVNPILIGLRNFFRPINNQGFVSSLYVTCFLLLEFSKSHNAYNARSLFIIVSILYICRNYRFFK